MTLMYTLNRDDYLLINSKERMILLFYQKNYKGKFPSGALNPNILVSRKSWFKIKKIYKLNKILKN